MIYLFGDLIDKNISKRVLNSILIVAVAIASLDFLFTFLSEISDLSSSYLLTDALIYSAYSIPGSIYTYLSYICLLGVLIGLGSLQEEGEIIGAKVLGKSNFNMVTASLRPALLIIAIGFIFQETLLPSISQTNEETRLVKQSQLSTDDGYWFASQSSINFFQSSPSRNTLNEITIYELGDENNILKITESKLSLRDNREWTLYDLRINDLKTHSISYLEEKIWEEGPNESVMQRILSPKYLSIFELRDALTQEVSEYRRNNLYLEYWRKIFHPLTTVLLILLAASFIFGKVRENNLGQRILLGILFAFSLNIIQNLFESMAAVSFLTPLSAVILPMIIISLITIFFWNLKSH